MLKDRSAAIAAVLLSEIWHFQTRSMIGHIPTCDVTADVMADEKHLLWRFLFLPAYF